MLDGSINPTAVKKGTRIAIKLAYISGLNMGLNELDQSLFRTWRDATVMVGNKLYQWYLVLFSRPLPVSINPTDRVTRPSSSGSFL